MRLGLRRGDDDAARLLGCRARARPGRTRRRSNDAPLLGRPGVALALAGLRDVETKPLVVAAAYDDFDDYWSSFPSGLGPSGAYCASLDDDAQDALRVACFRRLGSPNGAFTLSARAWFVPGSV